jgi:hypothetical protein
VTAEIAVMNTEAVALAADSAVTLDFSSGPKVFSSANKIFALSAAEPVGVMIFGDATFVGMPWETIIKEFRRKLGSEALSTIADYADRFFDELLSHEAFTGPAQERRSFFALIYETYRSILQAFLTHAKSELEDKEALDETDLRSLLAREVRSHKQRWRDAPQLEGLPTGFAKRIRQTFAAEVGEIRELVFEDLPMSSATSRVLGEIAGLMFTHRVPPGIDLVYSGIVIAGFGSEEFFPHLARQRVYGVAGGRIRIEDRQKIDIDVDNNAVIAPFAQREMVDAFIEGLEPGYGKRADLATVRLASDLIENALERAGLDEAARDGVERAMVTDIRDRFGELAQELADIRTDHNVQPIIEVVAALPKDELAAMAESLVNLTSFKRRVSKSAETVGGPIDVAVISRGDGFVWIRRKHYFPPELNPRYMANLTGRNNG